LPNHGFDKSRYDSLLTISPVYKDLIEILIGLDGIQRKQFLLFVTGSPRLPLGGNYYIELNK